MVEMYITATKLQLDATNKMIEHADKMRAAIESGSLSADRVRDHFDETLDEVNRPKYIEMMNASEEARKLTEELHARVREIRSLLFPLTVN